MIPSSQKAGIPLYEAYESFIAVPQPENQGRNTSKHLFAENTLELDPLALALKISSLVPLDEHPSHSEDCQQRRSLNLLSS